MEHAGNRLLLCTELIGRSSEVAALGLLLEQAAGGSGRLALVSGEAGIGKSRLVAEVKARAESQGFLVVQGVCFPGDAACPYAPIVELVRSLFGRRPPEALLADLGALAPLLFPFLPDLIPPSPDLVPPLTLEPEQAKRRLEALLAQFFLHQAAGAPLLLVVEDLHWSDAGSLDFISYLARRAASQPLLLLATYRRDEVETSLGAWLAELDRERLAREIQLLPLARPEVDSMLSSMFDERHTSVDMRRFLHTELLETLYTLTDGNPFFVEEVLSSLLAAGDIFSTAGYWNRKDERTISIPRSVQDSVERRLAQVSEEARQISTLAAVAGRRFDFALLQQLTHYDEHQLLVCMKELVAAQLVMETDGDQFAFRHALTRQAIYSRLLTRERRQLHRSIAETLEHEALGAVETHLEDLASHFYQAGDWEKTLDYARRAGEKAASLYAHRAAIAYFSWVLEANRSLSLPDSSEIYRARGQAYEVLGEFAQAERDYTQAVEAARALGDPAAEWQGVVDIGFLWAGRDYGQSETWFRRALQLAESLEDPLLHARSLNRIGNWYLNVERPGDGLRAHQQALELFLRLEDSQGVADTLDLLGMASYLGGDVIGGTAYYKQSIARFSLLRDQSGLTSSLATLALRGPTYQTDSLVSAATLAEAYRDAEAALEIARAIGHRSAEAYALFQVGLCLGSQGEYSRALAAVRQSLDIGEEIAHHQWQAAAHSILAGLYRTIFAYAEALAHSERALELARETGSLFWTRIATGYSASIAVLRHDSARATALLYDDLASPRPAVTMAERIVRCAAVELALERGEASQALEMIDQLIASQPASAQGRRGLRLLTLRGEALLALERTAEAEVDWREAQALAEAGGARPIQWRIALALGRLCHAQGRDPEAEQALTAARTLIDDLASTMPDGPLKAHFRQEAAALFPFHSPAAPSSPPAADDPTRQEFGGLTPREREVAILIARGESNQAIADMLVVTKRTVETHIGNIMFKLGSRSRTQIAVWAVETGLTGPDAPGTSV